MSPVEAGETATAATRRPPRTDHPGPPGFPADAGSRRDAGGPASGTEPLLRIERLSASYPRRATAHGPRAGGRVLSRVDLEVRAGEILGVIGETGSGKTTLARATVGLLRPDSGRVLFEGRDLTGLGRRALRDFRRSGQAPYMFQDPLRSLDPDLTVRRSVAEPLAAAGESDRAARAERVDGTLELVGLDPAAYGDHTPGRLSGGQRQRVALARALVTRPRLLLTDEPVSALDASNRNLVLGLLDRLRRELGPAIVVISHDLHSLAGVADRVAVLYRGRLVEQGPAREVLEHPAHPYTALLTASAPRVRRAPTLRPDLLRVPEERDPWPDGEGCVFAPKCRFAGPECRDEPDARTLPEAELPSPTGAFAAPSSPARPAGVRTVACHRAADWRDDLG